VKFICTLLRSKSCNRKEIIQDNTKIEDGSHGHTKNRIPHFLRTGSSVGISALQSMGITLEGTTSILKNKLVLLIL